jgi:hypothetical protein
MPVQTTYPGVYVQEVPSGVRTIAGVSTSVTAFIGEARRGPINRAVTIFSYADFDRQYGGLSTSSEMSYSVRQFFLNGGTQAIIVRVAANPVAASALLQNAVAPLSNVLLITAFDEGTEGNQIEVRVDYQTANPDSLFNLVLNYVSANNPSDNSSETFTNLSMNSFHPRYVETIVNDSSRLVVVARQVLPATLAGLPAATVTSGHLNTAINPLDAQHNRFRIVINGSDPLVVQLNELTDFTGVNPLATLCAAIQAAVTPQGPGPIAGFTCVVTGAGNDQILMTAGPALPNEENSRIYILPGQGNDVSARLLLTTATGAHLVDGAAGIRPAPIPLPAQLQSGDLVDADIQGPPNPAMIDPTAFQFRISIDGGSPMLVVLAQTALTGAAHPDRMADLAARIQAAVRALRPTTPGFNQFTCITVPGTVPATDQRLQLISGSRGNGSSVVVTAEVGDALAGRLKLLIDTTANTATLQLHNNVMLQGGNEQPVTDVNRYDVYTGNQALRSGLYSLEGVDIFNLLCLPGINDPGIWMECDAYCISRRAFMIIDPPSDKDHPDEMATYIAGTGIPKSDSAAVYYPWIQIADPLNGGARRQTAPSGTMAGLYARIDGSRGVWKAPAGVETTLNGVLRLTYTLTDRENGYLNPMGINCLRSFPDAGSVSWGSRTLAGADSLASEWKYIPVRRTALFIEESLYRGLKWVVFEPNDEPLWAQIRLNVGAFMHELFRQGAFEGSKASDAYFVKCDKETTTQNDINLGRVNIWVGFQPLKPAEFVILYLQQMAGQIQV